MDTAARAFLLFSRTYKHSLIRRFCQMRPRSIVHNSNTVGAILRQRWPVVLDRAATHLSSLGKLQSSVPQSAIRNRRLTRKRARTENSVYVSGDLVGSRTITPT